MKKMIASTDFSASSAIGIKAAKLWSSKWDWENCLLYFDQLTEQIKQHPLPIQNLPPEMMDLEHWAQTSINENIRNQLLQLNLQIEDFKIKIIPGGKRKEELITYLKSNIGSILFLGSTPHRWVERMFVGSFGEKMATLSPIPLFIARDELKIIPKKIIFYTDFSEPASRGQVWAQMIAKNFSAEVEVVNLVSTRLNEYIYEYPYDVSSTEFISKILAQEEEMAKKKINEIVNTFNQEGVKAKGRVELVKNFDVPDAVLNDANSRDCDLVVLASHGRKGLESFLVGSVAQIMLRQYHGNIFLANSPL